MNENQTRGVSVGASFFLLLASANAVFAAADSAARQTLDPDKLNVKTLRLLEENRQRQLMAARKWKVFHDFQFVDRYEESGIRFEQQVVDDAAKYWKPAHYDHGSAIAVADVDGDDRLDIYFVNQLGGNQLWRNLGNGKFENITVRAGVGLDDKVCVAASFADIDNDGLPDLFVTTVRMGNVLFKNMGNGQFKDITKDSSLGYVGHSSGAVFFDFNKDGLLDLFLVNVGVYTIDEKGRGGYYRAHTNAFSGHLFPERSEQSMLYQNLGGGQFKDVSKEMNLQHRGWSGDASFCDLNQDGYPDLYVLNMQGDDRYYENDHGKRFGERTAGYFPKTPWGAMGIKFFDFNNDGLFDLFVTDMHSDMTDAQTRVGKKDFSGPFEKQKSEVWCSIDWTDAFLQGASNNIFGNAFYLNQGNGKFIEVSDKIGAETYWPWGISVADLNADGYEDVFVTAGMGYPFRYGINSVLLNENGQRFVDSEFVLGVEPRKNNRIEKVWFTLDCSGADDNHIYCYHKSGLVGVVGSTTSRSSVSFDLDDDGDLDIVTNEQNDRPLVLISNLAEKKQIHYLKIKLVGTASNRDGLGATVKVRCGSKTYTRYHDGKSGYLAQSSLPLYFGLGDAVKIDRVEVLWPSGKKQTLSEKLPINTLVTITENR
ncbi:MAG TPA: CRTAC1 family protein [Candidatus Eisenbacteria bacterium]|nr:CRTAC1 family protein [Candidatus Eisenbacteria bacterium]